MVEMRWRHTFLPLCFFLTSLMQHPSDAEPVWWRCVHIHASMTAPFPTRAQVSVNQVCLQTAARGWNRRADSSGRVCLGRTKLIKNHYRRPSTRNLTHYPSLLVIDLCSQAIKAARQQMRRERKGQTVDTCLLLRPLLKVSSVNILTSSGVSVRYLQRQSFLTFPGFRFVLHSSVSSYSLWWNVSGWGVRLRACHLHTINTLVLLFTL